METVVDNSPKRLAFRGESTSTPACYHTKTARCAVLVLMIVGLLLTGCSSRTVRGTAPAPIVDVYEAASNKLTQMGYSLTEANRDRAFLKATREDKDVLILDCRSEPFDVYCSGVRTRTLRIQMESTADETTAFEVTYTWHLLRHEKRVRSELRDYESAWRSQREEFLRVSEELIRGDAAALVSYLEGLAGRR